LPTRLSLRALARRLGVSLTAVQKAIRSGRLGKSVGRDARGPFVANAALAVREWAAGASQPANGGRRSRPGSLPTVQHVPPVLPAGGTLVDAQVRVAGQRADALELANKRKRGELVDAATVERENFEVARMLRERILNVPDRLGELDPSVRGRLRAELRQALGDIAEDLERE
jgi:hypothetical protein